MNDDRKNIIRFALQFDINDIHTYSGYKGGLVLKITTRSAHVVNEIEKYALSIPIEEVAVKKNHLMLFEIYCITKDSDVYELKLK
jgi:hypothetical protein